MYKALPDQRIEMVFDALDTIYFGICRVVLGPRSTDAWE